MLANFVLQVGFLAQRCSAAGIGAPSGPALAQEAPAGAGAGSRRVAWHSMALAAGGRVAGHLLAWRRLRGASRAPLKHFSLLSPFFPCLGPIYCKELPAPGSALAEGKARLESSRARAPRAGPALRPSRAWLGALLPSLPPALLDPHLPDEERHGVTLSHGSENKGHSQQRESHERDFQK